MKIVAGNSNRPLAEAIATYLNLSLCKASVRRFSDMECFVEIDENVRGEDVFVIQSTSNPANDNLMELLVCIDALRRASARRITAVLPYFGYARQDRKPGPRTPISDYPHKGRGGLGVINRRTGGRNGEVSGMRRCHDDDDVMFSTQRGMIVRTPVSATRPMGRNVQGMRLVNLKEGDRLIDVRLTSAKTTALRDAALALRAGGVGYYAESNFVHLDTGKVRSW